MTRQQKYPDTATFHFHNANPKNRLTTDCVIRAISTALEIPYNTVVMELATMQCDTGYDDGDAKLYDKYLKSKGWEKHKQPRKLDGTKFTADEWCKCMGQLQIERRSNIVAHIGGKHVAAIIDCKVWDTWDCTDGCIGNFWTKV